MVAAAQQAPAIIGVSGTDPLLSQACCLGAGQVWGTMDTQAMCKTTHCLRALLLLAMCWLRPAGPLNGCLPTSVCETTLAFLSHHHKRARQLPENRQKIK